VSGFAEVERIRDDVDALEDLPNPKASVAFLADRLAPRGFLDLTTVDTTMGRSSCSAHRRAAHVRAAGAALIDLFNKERPCENHEFRRPAAKGLCDVRSSVRRARQVHLRGTQVRFSAKPCV
jgi:hypothetical protein